MSWLRKVKTLNTACSVQATGKLFKLPWAGKETSETQVYDKSRRLAEIDWDRIVLFNGKWHLPPVTVKPRFEVWNYVKLQSDSEPDSEPEPKLLIDPKISAIFRTKNLLLVGAGVIGVVGILCYLHRQQRKRFAANVAASAASLRDVVSQAVEGAVDQVQEAFQGAVYQQDILTALENAVQVDIGQTSNVTAGEVTEGHLNATGEDTNTETFLQNLGVVVSEPTLQSGAVKVRDLVTSSVQQLVERGMSEDNAQKMKVAVSNLLGHPLI